MEIHDESWKRNLHGVSEFDIRSCTKKQILNALDVMIRNDEILYSSLIDECVFYKRPDRLRLPLIFYYGHTACVFINKLVLVGMMQPEERINVKMDTLFETGVDEQKWDDVENYRLGGCLVWPRVNEVTQYRRQVFTAITDAINRTQLHLPITKESVWWAVLMGISHAGIHNETTSILIRQLPVNLVQNPGVSYGPVKTGHGHVTNCLVTCDNADVSLGKPENHPTYSWDCDYGHRRCRVDGFECSKYKISNGEFLKFVEDKAYLSPAYWTKEGWQWRNFKQSQHPSFWICDKGCKNGCGGDLAQQSHCNSLPPLSADDQTKQSYRLRVMFDVINLPLDWPVEVNYHEAKAYCAWLGPEYRLPIEAERQAMIGREIMSETEINTNNKHMSPTPVNMFPASNNGFHDLFGNVWEWHEDCFNGLPGYQTDYLYDDYSANGMDGLHTVLQGGSWITTYDHTGRHCRNTMRRHFIQHAGFRVARNATTSGAILPVSVVYNPLNSDNTFINLDRQRYKFQIQQSANIQFTYETPEVLAEYLTDEYLSDDLPISVIIVNKFNDITRNTDFKFQRALYVGAATGRGPFHLAASFKQILAVDYCASFIDTAQHLQDNGCLDITLADAQIRVNYPQALETRAAVTLKQLSWLPNEVGLCDLVVFNNIERFNNPKAWIKRFNEIVLQKGIVAIATACNNRNMLETFLGNRFEYVTGEEAGRHGRYIHFWIKN